MFCVQQILFSKRNNTAFIGNHFKEGSKPVILIKKMKKRLQHDLGVSQPLGVNEWYGSIPSNLLVSKPH